MTSIACVWGHEAFYWIADDQDGDKVVQTEHGMLAVLKQMPEVSQSVKNCFYVKVCCLFFFSIFISPYEAWIALKKTSLCLLRRVRLCFLYEFQFVSGGKKASCIMVFCVGPGLAAPHRRTLESLQTKLTVHWHRMKFSSAALWNLCLTFLACKNKQTVPPW